MNKSKIYSNMEEMLNNLVKPGMYIHIASTMCRANALTNLLIKLYEGKNPDFTFSITAIHGNMHAIAFSGIAKKIITGFLGDNYPKPRSNCLYENVLKNNTPFEVEQVSLLALVTRLMGGALNLPYMTTRSLLGSDFENVGKNYVKKIDGEKDICLVESLFPDVTFVHGICADEKGNVILSSPMGEGRWGALAAQKGVIATVEKIVSSETISEYSDRVVIPSSHVIGVCEVPFGGYPQSMNTNNIGDIQGYYDDYEYYQNARDAAVNPELKEKWMDCNIREVNYSDYISVIPTEIMKNITSLENSTVCHGMSEDITMNEILIILAARTIVSLVKEHKYETILAGIGMSHIACWVAKKMLEKEGIEIHLIAELGFYGYVPYRGDAFLFSQRHTESIESSCDVLNTLGTEISYKKKCLGVIGSAEIDTFGNINTSCLPDGTYMTGSGGANDIASVTDCLVVSIPGKRRFVNKVNFITSPGKNVKNIITTFGRFTRQLNGTFELVSWFNAKDKYGSPVDAIRDYTEWNSDVSQYIKTENDITEEERLYVLEADREGIYRL